MKYIDEYRDAEAVRRFARAIARITTREWAIMEICGGQTHAIVKYGVDELLPPQIQLLHGPGCPVCVTPVELIDKAVEIAARPDVIFTSFGDMLRVPGTHGDLLSAKSRGGDVRIVYSPLDALKVAQANPTKQVVFFAVGFETTAPANAMAVYQAAQQKIENFSILVSHVLVPPAIEAILGAPGNRVQGFLAAGHVCAVVGYEEYYPLAQKYHVPFVVTGFEPLDIMQGIYMTVRQLESGRAEVENQYVRCVRREGNVPAQQLVSDVFRSCHASGAVSAKFPTAASVCARHTPPLTPSAASNSRITTPKKALNVSVAKSCKASASRLNVPLLGRAARRSIHSARRWSRLKARVPPTTAIVGWRCSPHD